MDPIVVVGAGLAGYGVLRELRRLNADVPLTLIADDRAHFYSKPMLSTALAKDKTATQLVTTSADTMAANLKLDLKKQTRVLRILPDAHAVETETGLIRYSRLILALGAEPIRIPIEGDRAHEVLSVNHLEEYETFRAKLEGKKHVLIIGAGLIGCEFANDLSASGFEVTVVDLLVLPLQVLVPPKVGAALKDALSKQGVKWRFNVAAQKVAHAGEGFRTTLSDGSEIESDVVLSAVGLKPRTSLAAAAGIAVRRGILVDGNGRTNMADIYALGDCAEYSVGVCQYVTPIMSAARAVAASALGNLSEIKFPVLSVIVKTTAYPIALLRPAEGVAGEWYDIEDDADGMKLGFRTSGQAMAGYVLTAGKTAQRADLDKEIAAAQA